MGGDAEGERAGGDFGAGRDDGTGCDECAFADDSSVEDDGAVGDEGSRADGGAVDDAAVGDGDLFADEGGVAGAAVDDGAVLDVGAAADDDVAGIAANDGAVPDGCVGVDGDIADDGRGRGDEGGGMDARGFVADGVDGHGRDSAAGERKGRRAREEGAAYNAGRSTTAHGGGSWRSTGRWQW